LKAKITIKSIAKELGVSNSTVSKALNDSTEISLEMRKKIKAFADFHNYRPNKLAIKLRNNKTMVIGIVIPEIVHHFFSRVISGVEKVAKGRGYNVMICLSNESYEKEVLNLKMLTDGSVDGLLVSIAKETLEKGYFNHFKELKNYNIPLVLFDRVSSEQVLCDKVIIDDVGGGFKATKHLLDIGCKKIALISTPDYVTVGALRKKGYLKALTENSIDVDERLMIHVNESLGIYEQINNMFDSKYNMPDGIFAVNEIYAATAIKIAKERGLQVPNDIAIIGFTDGIISEFSTPTLSTVDQHGFMMGEIAGEMLLNRIQDKNKETRFERKVISTNLKIRESTRKE